MPCFYPDSASSILEFADDAFYRELSQARLFEVVQITLRFARAFRAT